MRKKIVSLLLHAELALMSLIVLVPMLWIVMSAFQSGSSLTSAGLIPSDPTLANFGRLLTETNYPVWFFNTLKIAVVNTVLSLVLILLTAWVMSRFKFRGKKAGMMTILLLSMFPTFLSMTAIYTLFQTLGLLGNPLSLIIVYAIGAIPYNTWLVKGYLDGIPISIDEAAYIDGCGHFATFFRFVIPLSAPIITYCAVSQFMLPWMDYILPNLLLRGDANRTLAVGLYALISGKENTNFTLFAAGAILVAVPITLLFFFFQKYLQQGIASGADKG